MNEADKKCKGCKDCDKKKSQWREDFPVRWEDDDYITRREMVKFLALGSCLLTGANVVVALVPHLHKIDGLPQVLIAGAGSLKKNDSLLFRYPTADDPCLMVNTEKGLVAYSQVCTHLSCAVVHSEKDNALFCPCHNGYFTVDEGRPYAGPPVRRLPRIKLEHRGDQTYAVGVEV